MPETETMNGVDRRTVATAVLTPLVVIGIRTTRVYLQSVLGLLTAGSLPGLTGIDLGQGMLPHEFGARLSLAASLSVAIAAVTCLQNFLELLAKLDRKFPEIRA